MTAELKAALDTIMRPGFGETKMGEGTVVFNVQEEIAALKRRIATLEAKDIQVKPVVPTGCVCPAGAEATCGNIMCPRRAPPGYVRPQTTW